MLEVRLTLADLKFPASVTKTLEMRTVTSSLAATLALALLLVLPSAASAMATIVSPVSGSKVKTATPRFSWRLPAGEHVSKFFISDQPVVNSNGVLSGREVYNHPLFGTEKSVRLPEWAALKAGTYFWQLTTTNEGVAIAAPVQKLVVPNLLVGGGFKVKYTPTPQGNRDVELHGWVRGNLKGTCKLRLELSHGRRKLESQRRKLACSSWRKVRIFDGVFSIRAMHGERLTARYTITGADVTFRSPPLKFINP